MKRAALISGGIESAVMARLLADQYPDERPLALYYDLGRLCALFELHFARRIALQNGLAFQEADFSKFWKPLLGFFDPTQISLEFDSKISPGAGSVANGFPVTLRVCSKRGVSNVERV